MENGKNGCHAIFMETDLEIMVKLLINRQTRFVKYMGTGLLITFQVGSQTKKWE